LHTTDKGRILDVGCFNGYFLDEARKNGWDVYGVEPTAPAATYAKDELKLKNVMSCTLKEANYPDNYFDVVTLYHVMEHLPIPSNVLQEITRIIKKEGLLVVEVPNCNFWMKLMKSKFRYLQPDHYWYFTRKTLFRILRNTGFEPFKFQHVGKTVVLDSMLKRWVGLYSSKLGNLLSWFVNMFRLGKSLLYINIGDIMITYSKKKSLE
jgi:SAM-dependent methyltransferase